MLASQAGSDLARNYRASIAHAAMIAVFATLGGCASTDNAAHYSAAGAETRVAQVAQIKTEIEADGLPEQTPPLPSIRTAPDDPSEPFSRNYGGVNPSATAAPLTEQKPENNPKHKLPDDLPVDFRRKLVAALDVAN